MQKQVQLKIKGMQRDLSVSAFNPEYAYDNYNIRIMPTDESTLLSIINEKGNKKVDLGLLGTPIGQVLIGDELVVFTHQEPNPVDRIYKIAFNTMKELKATTLYEGILNMSLTHPIEALAFYENEEIKKIYWTDGLNQPRVINIADNNINVPSTYFNFVRSMTFKEVIYVDRLDFSSGNFAPGIIQYAFTYFKKYGQETNIFYITPLNYISYTNRGASPEDKVSTSFNISIANLDKSFDYVRVYSIHRTSLDAIPTCKRVVDLGTYDIPDKESILDFPNEVQLKRSIKTPEIHLCYITATNVQYDCTLMDAIREKNAEVVDLTRISLRTVITRIVGGVSTQYTLLYIDHTISGKGVIANTKYAINSTNNPSMAIPTTRFVFSCPSNMDPKASNLSVVSYYFYDTAALIIPLKVKQFVPAHSLVTYVDNGTTGDTIDPTELLYVGGEDLIFNTMTQKDNTLFLGDITLNRKPVSAPIIKELRSQVSSTTLTWQASPRKYIPTPEASGFYPYKNQLSLDSSELTTFKYLEYYRLGIQALHITGKWSEPIWITDSKNTQHIEVNSFWKSTLISQVEASFVVYNNNNLFDNLINLGYTKIRPVVVYPEMSDRECICQGALCPTVYNVKDRYDNSPFVQSSWFYRPNAPFDIMKAARYKQDAYYRIKGDPESSYSPDLTLIGEESSASTIPNKLSRASVMENRPLTVLYGNSPKSEKSIDMVNKGSYVEFRHNRHLPANDERNAEIQSNNKAIPKFPLLQRQSIDLSSWHTQRTTFVQDNPDLYGVDQSIVTLHSPDIEFDTRIQALDTTNLRLRIVGIIPLTSCASSIDIQTSTPPNPPISGFSDFGLYSEEVGTTTEFEIYSSKDPTILIENESLFGWKSLVSSNYWRDSFVHKSGGTVAGTFAVYPWHRNGSLNATIVADSNGRKSAMLLKKKMANLRVSYKTSYFNSDCIWTAESLDSPTYTPAPPATGNVPYFTGAGISGVSIFNSEDVSLAKLPAPLNSGLDDITYYGNIDKLISSKGSYPIAVYYNGTAGSFDAKHEGFVAKPNNNVVKEEATDPIIMKYKSTPHAVIALNYDKEGNQRILPTIFDVDYSYNMDPWIVNSGAIKKLPTSGQYWVPFWNRLDSSFGCVQDVIPTRFLLESRMQPIENHGLNYGWLWLGELYNPNVQNRFGGQSEEAFENNKWLPAGEPVSIENVVQGSYIEIKWTEGDTYFQRYDNLKTYPFTNEDQNSVIEIGSFMCETRVNIDGRYDKNRGQSNNLAVSPNNFNLLNPSYSQLNNFFNYRGLNPSKKNLNNFHNTITWSKTKAAGEFIDTWTNLTMASTLDLDGDKGKIRSLKRFNNNLIAFQDRGISHILYNENMQFSSTEGVPIEIANSGKVSGKRYITDRVGCTNKWSICETSNGIYFTDDITKGIMLFNGQVSNISDKYGFHSWINTVSDSVSIWDPLNFNGMVTYYDKVNGDVFFITKHECLAFSESLGCFTSFYSYERVPYFINLLDKGIFLQEDARTQNGSYYAWLHNEGAYNNFFGNYMPFYTTIIANPEITLDKTYDSIEYRSDSWSGYSLINSTVFDNIKVWNEYQIGESSLLFKKGIPSTLKKKFNVWRVAIPRANSSRARMRSPWLYLKLGRNAYGSNPDAKTILHDIVVKYSV